MTIQEKTEGSDLLGMITYIIADSYADMDIEKARFKAQRVLVLFPPSREAERRAFMECADLLYADCRVLDEWKHTYTREMLEAEAKRRFPDAP